METCIERRRVEWLGSAITMCPTRVAKKVRQEVEKCGKALTKLAGRCRA
jgi:hypothetical protein